MATPDIVFVQSISGLGGKAVAGTVLSNSVVVQWVTVVGTDIPAAVQSHADGNALATTLIGAPAVMLYAPTSAFVSAVASTLTTSADHLLFAGITGQRRYVTALTVSVASVGGVLDLKDSSGVLWSSELPAQSGPHHLTFPVPLRGTLTSSLLVACQTSGAQARVAASGFAA